MTNKNTKRALLTSVMSLLLCFTMLLGTTYAWFTDSVSSANNKIVAGSLKVDLELLDKETGEWNSLKESQDPIFTYENWEPGYTDVKVLKVENEGTLALKWRASFVATEKLSDLANVIDVYVLPSETAELAYPSDLSGYTKVGTLQQFVNTIEETTYGVLAAGKCAYLGIALKMQETAGNAYQSMRLGSFDIVIFATQQTAEEDSFNGSYDKDATYTAELDALRAALATANAGDVVNFTLTHDAYAAEAIVVPNGVILNLDGAGYTIYANDEDNSPNGLLAIHGGTIKNLNVVTDAKVATVASPRAIYITAPVADTIIDNCYFRGGYAMNVNTADNTYGIYATNSTFDGWTSIGNIKEAKFTGCTFTGTFDSEYMSALGYSAARVRPNCDTTYENCSFKGAVLQDAGKTDLTLTYTNCKTEVDGVMVDITAANFFDRTTADESAKLAGCTIVINGAPMPTLATPDNVQSMINAAAADEGDIILLTPGTYTETIVMKSKITLVGSAGAIVYCINLNGADNVTLKNIDFDAAGAKRGYDGRGTAKQYANIISGDNTNKPLKGAFDLVIDGCTFTGTFANGGASIAFTDQNRSSGGSGNVTIKNCTFDTVGAYYDIYGHYTGNGANGYGDFVIENNTFKTSFTQGGPIYLGRYASSTPVVVKDNTFAAASQGDAMFVQDHSNYGVSISATNNTYGA